MYLRNLFRISNNIYPTFALTLRLFVLSASLYGTVDEFTDSMNTSWGSQHDTFDFIIVGAGSAGSVLASRLSEHFKVLLLEAGGRPSPINYLPILTFPMYWDMREDWKYETVPQKYSAFGLNNNMVHWSAGKVLGGSSGINGMIYIRGTVQGFDIVANQTGDPIWSMENVLKYYQRIENYDGYFDKGVHGKDGKIKISKGYLNPYVKYMMEAGEELGYKVRDPNPIGPLTEGFAPMELYVNNGWRWSAFDGYIRPLLRRSSLTIRKYSYGYKVILDDNNVAVGIEYLRHGKHMIAKATKEVILSAGAVQSPKILMLSGIGPRNDLEALGIKVKVDLPVGQRLQDKFGAFVGPFIVDAGNSFNIVRDYTLSNYANLVVRGKGVFTTSLAEATYSVLSQKAKESGETTPDLHSYIIGVPLDTTFEQILFKSSFNVNADIVEKYFRPAYGLEGFMQLVAVNKPTGYGTLKLRDAQPMSPPLVDPNYLADKSDKELLTEAIKFSVKVMEETKAMQKINTKLLPTPIPGCEHVEFRSDAYWECIGRTMTATAYKYCSTAPMGKDKSDPIAVVDSRLRVFGTKNLRVVDASVLQERYVSVNHVTCTMLGELVADFILQEYSISSNTSSTTTSRSNHERNSWIPDGVFNMLENLNSIS